MIIPFLKRAAWVGGSILALSCGGKAPEIACAEVCTGAGFTSSSVDAQPNETNCFCTGGSGTVTDESCKSMCTSIGKSVSQSFKSGVGATSNNSCQCS